jgi:creatinine amidohydrolase
MGFRHWQEMTSGEIAALDAARCVAVLPLAATEQHGPHLPTGTDALIAHGVLAEAARHAPEDLDVVLLPVVDVGASLEHRRFAGTLTVSAAQLIDTISAVAEGVARAGLEKLVLVSSHGGNISAMQAAALELRARHSLLAVTLTFARLGLPFGLVDEEEQLYGVHGGLIETALMLHFRPDLVAMDQAADFPSLQRRLSEGAGRLRAYGPIGFGWLAGDLNPAGATGNAAGATPALGAAIAAHQAAAFVALLEEIAAADLASLLGEP